MKYLFLLSITFFVFSPSFSQIKHFKNLQQLLEYNTNAKSESIIIFGKFRGQGKYSPFFDTASCKKIDPKEFRKITTAFALNLFNDSTKYYLPVSQKCKLYCDYDDGEMIKLKVRIYQKCKRPNNQLFFLIEEIL